MDILTFGSPKLIKNLFSYKKNPLELNLDIILNELKLSYNEFIELCILFGCDYCKRITNIKSQDLYNIYLEEKNIEKTINKLHNLGYYVKNNNNYELIKDYFMNQDAIIKYSNIVICKPNYNDLYNLLINKYGFIKEKIINKFNKLRYINNF
jgi:flap endonuclease-1